MAHSFIAPGAGLAEIAARLEREQCDMVEIDVMSRAGELVVAHSAADLKRPTLLTLESALHALSKYLPSTMGLIVDLKGRHFERQVVNELRLHDLTNRTLISTMELASLPLIREQAPEIQLGWSVPKASRDYLAHFATRSLAYAALVYYRRVMPTRVIREIDRGHVDAVMAYWRVVTRELCDAVQGVGADVYAWTVDDRERVVAMKELGVTGVITNDPEVFATA